MDRVHYRRVTPSRMRVENAPQRQDDIEPTASESVILQCIVSGMLMLAVLMISLFNTAPTAVLRNRLREALSGANTPQELFYELRSFAERESTTIPEYSDAIRNRSHPSPVNGFESPTPRLGQEHSLFDLPSLTATYEALNPQIPGSSAVPELWD